MLNHVIAPLLQVVKTVRRGQSASEEEGGKARGLAAQAGHPLKAGVPPALGD